MWTAVCPGCGDRTMSGNRSFFRCECGYRFNATTGKIRETLVMGNNPKRVKRTFSKVAIQRQVDLQGNKCFWCGRAFGTRFQSHRDPVTLNPRGDHFIPFSFCYSTKKNNLVATCQICNAVKGNRIFQTEQDCRDYVCNAFQKYVKRHSLVEVSGTSNPP